MRRYGYDYEPEYTELTERLAECILTSAKQWPFRYVAAQAHGVRPETLDEWEERAGSGEEPYATFFVMLRRALAVRTRELGRRMLDGDERKKSESRAITWVLERADAMSYGDKRPVVDARQISIGPAVRDLPPADVQRLLSEAPKDSE